MMPTYQGVPSVAARLEAVEEAAKIADAEAEKLEALAKDMEHQITLNPRRGLKWRMEEFRAGARAARRIASSIRSTLTKEEEEG